MQLSDIQRLISSGYQLRFESASYSDANGQLCVNGRVGLPLFPISSSVMGGPDIPITEAGGANIGVLTLTTRLQSSDPSNFTDDQYIAYLTECAIARYGADYSFTYDYVILPETGVSRYETLFRATSGLWGGFEHLRSPPQTPKTSSKSTLSLTARDDLSLPTAHHAETLFRASQLDYAFERYLKLYHLLELLFDWLMVEELKALGSDLRGCGEVISRYTNKEIHRLRWILDRKVTDTNAIAGILNTLPCGHALSKIVFFDFGKDGNPLQEWDEFEDLWTGGGVDYASYKKFRPKATTASHRTFIIELVSYWIYRIRCCIAHSRIGEYVMGLADEDFVIDVGEPLIRGVLVQVFSV